MNALYRLEDAILGPLGRLLDGAVTPTLARLVFLATLAPFFWSSAMTKLGEGIGGIFSPSAGAYVQILPAQMEAAGYDESKLGLLADLVVLAGMWAEFVIPALIVLGLFTRAASLAMIGFILVMSVVDIAGHGADAVTVGSWFDRIPDAKIMDQRLFWIFVLLIPIAAAPAPLAGHPAEARKRVAVMKEIGALKPGSIWRGCSTGSRRARALPSPGAASGSEAGSRCRRPRTRPGGSRAYLRAPPPR